MKNLLLKFAGALLLAFTVNSTALAAPLTGTITFGGGVMIDGSFPSPLGVNTWPHAIVIDADGSFSALSFGDEVTFANNWSFASGPVDDFWQVGDFSFDLTNSWISSFSATSIGVTGIGILNAPGYDATPGTWSFTTQAPGNAGGMFSFSASGSAVPDGGATALLLGVGLVGMSFVARRRKQVQA
jgi:hypothetical protein